MKSALLSLLILVKLSALAALAANGVDAGSQQVQPDAAGFDAASEPLSGAGRRKLAFDGDLQLGPDLR